MSMTMAQILKRTPPSRKEKAAYSKVQEVKVQKTAYGTVIYKAKVFSIADNQGNPKKGAARTVYVATVETNMKQTVVSCSCPDFAFTWEYALNKKKAARIEYCNGENPVARNPKLIPGCCGHLHLFGQILVGKGKVV